MEYRDVPPTVVTAARDLESQAGLARLLRFEGHRDTLRWLAGRDEQDVNDILAAAGSDAIADDSESAARFWALLADDTYRDSLAAVCSVASGDETFGGLARLLRSEHHRDTLQWLAGGDEQAVYDVLAVAGSDVMTDDSDASARFWTLLADDTYRDSLVTVCSVASDDQTVSGLAGLLRAEHHQDTLRWLAGCDDVYDVLAVAGSAVMTDDSDAAARFWALLADDMYRQSLAIVCAFTFDDQTRRGLARLLRSEGHQKTLDTVADCDYLPACSMLMMAGSSAMADLPVALAQLWRLVADNASRPALANACGNATTDCAQLGLARLLRSENCGDTLKLLPRTGDVVRLVFEVACSVEMAGVSEAPAGFWELIADDARRNGLLNACGGATTDATRQALARLVRSADCRDVFARLNRFPQGGTQALLTYAAAAGFSDRGWARFWALAFDPTMGSFLKRLPHPEYAAVLLGAEVPVADLAIAVRGLGRVAPEADRDRVLRAMKEMADDRDGVAAAVRLLTEPGPRSDLVKALKKAADEPDLGPRLRQYLAEPQIMKCIAQVGERAPANRELEMFLSYAYLDDIHVVLSRVGQRLSNDSNNPELTDLRSRLEKRAEELNAVGINYPTFIDGEVVIPDEDIDTQPALPGGFQVDEESSRKFRAGRPGNHYTGVVDIDTGRIFLHPISATERYPSVPYPLGSLAGRADRQLRNDSKTDYDVLLHGVGSPASDRAAHYQLAVKLHFERGIQVDRLVGFTVSQGHGNAVPGMDATHGPFQFRWRSRSLSARHFRNIRENTEGEEFTRGVLSDSWATAIRTALISEFGTSEELAEVRRQLRARADQTQTEPVNLTPKFVNDMITRFHSAKVEDIRKKTEELTGPPRLKPEAEKELRKQIKRELGITRQSPSQNRHDLT